MQIDRSHNEASLKLLAEGSEDAFEVLFNRYRPKVYRLALKFLKSSALAEEVVQEVFLKIWLKRAELDEVRNLDAYLFITTKNITLDAFRKLSNKAVAEGEYATSRDLTHNTVEYSLLDGQYRDLIQQAVSLLPAQQAKVYHMAKIEGLSHEAIAQEMNISKLTVKKHMANALLFIRHRLQRHVAVLLALLKAFDA